MQVQPSDSLRVAIAEMRAEMQSKGYPGRTRSLTALYVRCVEAGIDLVYSDNRPKMPDNYAAGAKKINIKFTRPRRSQIAMIALLHVLPQRDMVNILALWGLPAVMQYVDALGYNDVSQTKALEPCIE